MSAESESPSLIPPSAEWSADQALDYARRRDLDQVVIAGIDKDGNFVAYSSRMTRAEALWLNERARLHTLGA